MKPGTTKPPRASIVVAGLPPAGFVAGLASEGVVPTALMRPSSIHTSPVRIVHASSIVRIVALWMRSDTAKAGLLDDAFQPGRETVDGGAGQRAAVQRTPIVRFRAGQERFVDRLGTIGRGEPAGLLVDFHRDEAVGGGERYIGMCGQGPPRETEPDGQCRG